MKQKLTQKKQQGIAMLAVVLIITIFTIMGMMNAQEAKVSERIVGGTVRYNTVFEAAERTLRDASNYLLLIDGIPLAGDGSKGRQFAVNFDVSQIDRVKFSSNPAATIVWSRAALSSKVCGVNTIGCSSAGIDFASYLDKALWEQSAIVSAFDSDAVCGSTADDAGTGNVACDNYMRDIKTYTFIEQLRTNDGSGGGQGGETSVQGSVGLSGTGYETYYLITVKASGFPPGTSDDDKKNPLKARENVILQGVFARL